MNTRRATSLRPGQFKHLIPVASVTGRMSEHDVMLSWITEAWTSKIAFDPNREPHWDDAVKGLDNLKCLNHRSK